jgi:hypothetical protein
MAPMTDEELERWGTIARRRPTMGSDLVLALLAEVRDLRRHLAAVRLMATNPFYGGRLAIALALVEQLAGAGPDARRGDGFVCVDVAGIAALTGATEAEVWALVDDLGALGLVDVATRAVD